MNTLSRTLKNRVPLGIVGGFIIGFGVHSMLTLAPSAHGATFEPPFRETGKYEYISPLLMCGSRENAQFKEYKDFESRLREVVNAEKEAGRAREISVYFRDIRGRALGINENEKYAPASLLKVPLMITYLREAEKHPGLLSKQLFYDGSLDLNEIEDYKPTNPLKPGWHTIDEFITAMITDSGNNSLNVLYQHMSDDAISEVFNELGLSPPPLDRGDTDYLSPKSYSFFLRVLYNATYLSAEDSEKALELLAQTTFKVGLRASVPSGIEVADKFGERTTYTPDGAVVERQLHDCGIIYHPRQPYLLCIMTRGKDFDQLAHAIQAVGKVVYDEMDKIK